MFPAFFRWYLILCLCSAICWYFLYFIANIGGNIAIYWRFIAVYCDLLLISYFVVRCISLYFDVFRCISVYFCVFPPWITGAFRWLLGWCVRITKGVRGLLSLFRHLVLH